MRASQLLLITFVVSLGPAITAADPAQPQPAPQQAASSGPITVVIQPGTAITERAQTAQADLDEIVCRMSAPPTGSRLGGGKECHTVRVWNERQREDQKIVQRMQSGFWHAPGSGEPTTTASGMEVTGGIIH